MAKIPIAINDIYRLKLVSDPQISPDGTRVVFVVETMDKKSKKYYTTLYTIGLNGRRLTQMTVGKRIDHTPRWSPDGKRIAFVRREDTMAQIWILPLSGGEAKPLTRLKRGTVSNIVWSPSGKKIAFLFHPLGKEVELDKEGKPQTPVYRRIKDIWYRFDGEGFFDSEFTHLWVADARTGSTRQLIDGPYNDGYPCWSPNEKDIAFISFREEDWQIRLDEQDIFVVPVNSGKLKKIRAPRGPKEGLAYAPDGLSLAYLGHQHPYHSWGAMNYLLNTVRTNSQDHRVYGKHLDRTACPLTLGDITPSFVVTSPVWDRQGNQVYYGISDHGAQPVMCADVRTGRAEPVTEEDAVAISWSHSQKSDRLVYHGARLEAPDELFSINLSTRTTGLVTYLNRAYVKQRDFSVAEEISFTNGHQRLQGWLVKPPGFKPRKKYPLILNIHGGPRCQYGRTFYHEMYSLAAQGYVVVYSNPRGSQGYGEKFANSITGKWAQPAMGDCMAAVDYAVSLGFVDPERLGVTGGSYGGYMTNWIVTHTNRFKAAVTQRSVSNMASMFGTSDIGWDLDYEFKGTPWEQEEVYRKWSPITYIKNCHTPLLIIHSENDLRCNIEQGDQVFIALKYLKRKVEYIRFPEEPHGLSRHGRPDRRVARLELILEWFDRYLK